MAKNGLYANIHAKQERIKAGSGEKMRRVGAKGAPTKEAFIESAKTAKKKSGGDVSLSIKKGEKLPTSQGAGLTAKGRAKYNKARDVSVVWVPEGEEFDATFKRLKDAGAVVI